MTAESGDFQKTDKINAMDISVKGVEAESNGELAMKEDDYGKILRLALDGALRKMLPSIDKEFLAHIEAPAPLSYGVPCGSQHRFVREFEKRCREPLYPLSRRGVRNGTGQRPFQQR